MVHTILNMTGLMDKVKSFLCIHRVVVTVMSDITDYLPQGYQDLRDAGCEDSGCYGKGYALFVNDEHPSVMKFYCKIHYNDYLPQYDEICDEIFTLDDEDSPF